MAAKVKLTYSGPPVRVVELDRSIANGDQIEVDEALAGRLLAAAGFDGPDRLRPKEVEGNDPTRPHNAHPEGLYPDDEGFEKREPVPADPKPTAVIETPTPEPDEDED